MELQEFLDTLASTPEHIDFETTIAVIEENYDFTPAAFINGSTENAAGKNVQNRLVSSPCPGYAVDQKQRSCMSHCFHPLHFLSSHL